MAPLSANGLFSNNLINHLFDDNKAITVTKQPSNLVEVARVNEKYETGSFPNPQYTQNLKTMEMLHNNDAILNLNPSFFGGVRKADP